MKRTPSPQALPAAKHLANKAFSAIERFLHIEAVSGIVLLMTATIALIWANSPAAASYEHLWHIPLSIGLGHFTLSYPLHFWINDALMTVFFLVVGMEIRQEIHDGTLSNLKMATLPVAAALGGVAAPALIYLACNNTAGLNQGWAVPTATDIAFAVGVLALLGNTIPAPVRIFLLALAIIDDIIAVIIIALFYSGGLEPLGFLIAAVGILMVLGLQIIGTGSAFAYVFPGAILWFGLLKTGAHPTLAGVILGLMTPAVSSTTTEHTLRNAGQALRAFARRQRNKNSNNDSDRHHLSASLKQLSQARRELLPPVIRVQMALHPWVAYGVMPLFALANAGVNLQGINLAEYGTGNVITGVTLALVIGKPLGIIVSIWILVRMGWCRLPEGINWPWMCLIGCLAGIGFTMSIFIANLAFTNPALLGAAKLGVLAGSLIAGLIGLSLGKVLVVHAKKLNG